MYAKLNPTGKPSRSWSLQRRLRWMTIGAICNALVISGVLAYYGLSPLMDTLELVHIAPSLSRAEALSEAISEQRDLIAFSQFDENGRFSAEQERVDARLQRAIAQAEDAVAAIPVDLLPGAIGRIQALLERLRSLDASSSQDLREEALQAIDEALQDWFWQVNYSYVLPAVDQGKAKFLLANEMRILARNLRRELTAMLLEGELTPGRAASLLAIYREYSRFNRLVAVLYRDLAIDEDQVVQVGLHHIDHALGETGQFAQIRRIRDESPVSGLIDWVGDTLVPSVIASGQPVTLAPVMRAAGYGDWISPVDFYAAGGRVVADINQFMRDVSEVGRHRIVLSMMQTVGFYLILAMAPLLLMFINVTLARRTGKQVVHAAETLSSHFEKESETGVLAQVPALQGPTELIKIARAAQVQQDYLDRVADALIQLGSGNHQIEFEARGAGDVMGCALQQMIEANQRVVGQMQRIAAGDLSADLAPRAEHDDLVHSVNDMTAHLRVLQARVSGKRAELESANAQLEAQGVRLRESNHALAQHRDHLGQLVKERTAKLDVALKQAQDALLQVDRAANVRSEILARVSHEFRTPLQSVISSAEIAVAQLRNRQQVDPATIAVILDSAETLNQLIQDMLDFSTFASGEFELAREPFQLGEWVTGLCAQLERQHPGLRERLVVRLDAFEQPVQGDPRVLGAVVQQLLVNALQHAPDAPIELRVHVTSETDQARIMFLVVDDAGRLPPEDTETAFDAFWRGGEVNLQVARGTGLGLNMVRAVAQKMSGNCGAAVDPDRRTLFWFGVRLQLVDLPVTRLRSGSGCAGGSLRVLVAEDNPVSQKVILKVVEGLGHQASGAADGEQAVRMVSEQAFDVILMDLDMPRMNGLEATRAIHHRQRLAGQPLTPVVALTANAEAQVRSQCQAAGMVHFLAKPARQKQLAEAFRLVLGMEAPAAASQMAGPDGGSD